MSTPRRHVIMFQPRFARRVEDRTKRTTIRPVRKRVIRKGDVLDLREWTGKPYRSNQRKLREAVCTGVARIEISNLRWMIWITAARHRQTVLDLSAAEQLAARDGFENLDDLFNWFESTHALPFKGVLIEW